MNDISVIEVVMNNVIIGKLVINSDYLCAFEYDTEYIKKGVSISPYFLPLSSEVFMAMRTPFNGGFGVFNDSLPDGWGNLILDRYLREKGINPDTLSILERLSLVGSTGRGALEYYPDKSIVHTQGVIDFNKLAANAEKILTNEYNGNSLEELYQYSASSGGARPKVFVGIDNKQWLVKFKATVDPQDVGKVEYEYSLLAKECGVSMPETRLFEDRYFGVQRFDRTSDKKIHTVSAAGLINADYRIPSLDYSVLLKVCLQLTKDFEQVYDLFRLMVFNILISNRDDHAKNFSFQLIDDNWKLSPAYDILPSSGFNGLHTTTINGNGEPSMEDVLFVAKEVGLNIQRAKDIVAELAFKCKQVKMLKYYLK